MNRQVYVVLVLFLLLVFAFSSIFVSGVSQVQLTPTTGEPGDTIGVEGTDFAASTSVGIGLGPEVEIIDESVPVQGEWSVINGTTEYHPIKPGSFEWEYLVGAIPSNIGDNGDGTLNNPDLYFVSGMINYTTGFFTRTSSTPVDFEHSQHKVNYTTYEFDVTPAGLRTNSSGMLSGEFTVPDIWNGTEPVTVIDEAGNLAISDFTVEGSDIIPEPLTIGAIVLLSSAALVVSFYWLRKKRPNEMLKYS